MVIAFFTCSIGGSLSGKPLRTRSACGTLELPGREFDPAAAAGGGGLLSLPLELGCLLARLVSFQTGGVPLRRIFCAYRNVDNRSYVNA